LNTNRKSWRKSACLLSPSCTRELAVVLVECRVVPGDSLGVSQVPVEQAELLMVGRRAQPLKKSTKEAAVQSWRLHEIRHNSTEHLSLGNDCLDIIRTFFYNISDLSHIICLYVCQCGKL